MEGPPADAELYRYTEIESNSSFRLLKLLKGNGPELECELYPWLIQDEYPSYEALSYTWGSSEVVECIALNQKPFWITDNLHTALQSLRLRDRDRILWIDAICINQGDKLEQSHQVQQMGQIYGQAEKVLFWLGKATPQIIALMETLNQHPYNSSASHNMQEVFKDWPYEGHSIGFQQLLNREWFTRVWIVQEAAKARKADVCCGIRSIPAELFVRAFHLMKQEPPPHCKPVLDIMAESLRTGSWWTQARDLRILLQKFHASKATDERDKIYALLGMSSDPLDTRILNIDYQKPTSQVAHEAITHLLRPTNNQVKPLAVHEILNLMRSFETLDVTYFVPAKPQEDASEIIFPYLQTGYMISDRSRPENTTQPIAAFNNPALFIVEERPAANLENSKTCYSQAVKLMLDQLSGRDPPDGGYDTYGGYGRYGGHHKKRMNNKGLQVFPWGSIEHHVKVVVIHDKLTDVLKAFTGGFHQFARKLLHMKVGIGDEENCEALVIEKIIFEKRTEVLRSLLVDVGANVNAQGGLYGTALQAAAYRGSSEAVKVLLDAGADVNAQWGEYGTALQAAAYAGSSEAVRVLLDAGADVNAQGGKYGTALQAAA